MLARIALACGLLLAMTATHAEDAAGALSFTMNDIDGKPFALSQLKGKVVMIVNVASKCGNTPQYKGLEAAYQKYKEQGFVVLGVPANEFGAQEPGSNEDIKTFCSSKYNVTFPMLAKVVVKGKDICPLYQFLTTKAAKAGDISWNFEKFLIGRDGQIAARIGPRVKPEDPSVVAEIEKALAAK